MKTYQCICKQQIFFENFACVNCQRELGFLPDLLCVSSLEAGNENVFLATARQAEGRVYKKCQNYSKDGFCNWMIPGDNPESFCVSCRLDEMIPDLSVEKNRGLWKLIEAAKRRLVYTLISLELPLLNRIDDPKQGMAFRFLADGPTPETMVLTGHDEGVITLNIAEADDGEREKRRLSMKEPYRTLLGHFRHEIGHYYWDRLISGTRYLKPYRAMFGDERADYNQALKTYYASGPPKDWQENFISVYASAHPWEDWAESWAHYLHIQDMLEVALEFSLVDRQVALESKSTPFSSGFGLREKSFEEKIDAWSELTIALNSINRSMGLRDVYPFVLSDQVVAKLRFISEVIADRDVSLKFPPSPDSGPDPAGPDSDSQQPLDSNLAPAVSSAPTEAPHQPVIVRQNDGTGFH
jgi:hypothetical protein